MDLRLRDIFKKKVGIEGLTLDGAKVNSKDLVAEADIRGTLDHFHLHDDVDLGRKHVDLDKIEGRGLDLDIALRDTTVVDTTESAPLKWTANAKKADFIDSHIRFATPNDSMVVDADIDSLSLADADIDLEKQRYKVGKAKLKGNIREVKGAGVLEQLKEESKGQKG